MLQRHPAQAQALLDVDIAFGRFEHGVWSVERAAVPAAEGHEVPCALHRLDAVRARVERGPLSGDWQVLEWHDEERPSFG